MNYSIRFQIQGLLILIIVNIFYFLRKKRSGVGSEKVFEHLLIAAVANSFLDLASLVTIMLRDDIFLINNLINILYLISCNLFPLIVYRYVWNVAGKPKKFFGNLFVIYLPALVSTVTLLLGKLYFYEEIKTAYSFGVPVEFMYASTVYYSLLGVALAMVCRHSIKSFTRITIYIVMLGLMTAAVLSYLEVFHRVMGIGINGAVLLLLLALENPDIRVAEMVNARNREIGTEISVANKIQKNLLPNLVNALPKSDRFDVDADLRTCARFGGDFYDFYMLDDTHIAAVIADVYGNGIPATMLMVMTKMMIKNDLLDGKSPAECFRNVNANIFRDNTDEMCVSAFAAVIDIEKRILTFSNAGHEQPLVRWPDGTVSFLISNKNTYLGVSGDTEYNDVQMTMEQDTVFFMYTDGLVLRENKKGTPYGADRLLSSFESAVNERMNPNFSKIINKVRTDSDQFASNGPIQDDIAMLAIRLN